MDHCVYKYLIETIRIIFDLHSSAVILSYFTAKRKEPKTVIHDQSLLLW